MTTANINAADLAPFSHSRFNTGMKDVTSVVLLGDTSELPDFPFVGNSDIEMIVDEDGNPITNLRVTEGTGVTYSPAVEGDEDRSVTITVTEPNQFCSLNAEAFNKIVGDADTLYIDGDIPDFAFNEQIGSLYQYFPGAHQIESMGHSLRSIVIKNATKIGRQAFACFKNVQTILFKSPELVNELGEAVFFGMWDLKNIIGWPMAAIEDSITKECTDHPTWAKSTLFGECYQLEYTEFLKTAGVTAENKQRILYGARRYALEQILLDDGTYCENGVFDPHHEYSDLLLLLDE